MTNCGIYKITNLLEPQKVYIGKSVNLKKRYSDHFPPRKCEDSYIHRVMNAYGIENFSWEILEELEEDELLIKEREKFWIRYYHSFYKDPEYLGGYNLTEGGDGNGIESLKKAVVQYNLDGEYINKFESAAKASRETGISNVTILRCCNKKTNMAGGFIWQYAEEINKIEAINKTKIRQNNIRIFQFNTEGILLNVFDNLNDAAKQTNISKTSICTYCKDKKIHVNYIWRYENDIEIPLNIIAPYKNSGSYKAKKVAQYDKNTGELLQIYDSMKEAHRITGINNSNISEVCKNRRKTAGGYMWRYVDN